MAPTKLASVSELTTCACQGRDYKARDVVDAALFRGELDSRWQEAKKQRRLAQSRYRRSPKGLVEISDLRSETDKNVCPTDVF